jgi:hypothetical protein
LIWTVSSGRPVWPSIAVADRRFDTRLRATLDRRLRLRDQAAVENFLELMILAFGMIDRLRPVGGWLMEQFREIEAMRLPMLDHLGAIEHLHLADHLIERAIAEFGHPFAYFLSDEEEIIDDMLRLADEALAQHRVLRRDTDRTGVEMTLAHHDTASRNQRRGGETELIGAKQRAHDDIAARAKTAINLHCNAGPQPIEHERLMCLGETDLPRRTRMLDRGQRRSTGAALEARDRDMVGARLGNAGSNRADADFGDEFD